VRRFAVREVAIGQGATDARSAGLRRRAGLAEAQWGEGGGQPVEKKKNGPRLGRLADWAESEEIFFRKTI
jgi:hypothetical protein